MLYADADLIIYQYGVATRGEVLPRPRGLGYVRSLTTDLHSRFLLTSIVSHTGYVLDHISGNLTHTIPFPWDTRPLDCIVEEGQLWVACYNGDIVVISSR